MGWKPQQPSSGSERNVIGHRESLTVCHPEGRYRTNGKKLKEGRKKKRSSLHGSSVNEPTRICEDEGSIPGLT